MAQARKYEAGMAECGPSKSERLRNFVAIQDVPPQKTLFLSTHGEVLVGNPGVDVELSYAVPQGINSAILILNVLATQRPGLWPQVLTWKSVSDFRMIVKHGQYSQVHIMYSSDSVVVDVVDRV